MRYDPSRKLYCCLSCGLAVTQQELVEMRDKLRPEAEPEDERRKRERTEYLRWWLTKKEKRGK